MKNNSFKDHLLFSAIMGFIMTGFVSATLTYLNLKEYGFLVYWIKNWLISWMLASPLIFILAPRVKNWVMILNRSK